MPVAVLAPSALNKVNSALDALRSLLEVSPTTKKLFFSFLGWYLPVAEKKQPIPVRDAGIWIRNGGVVAIRQLRQAIDLLQKQLDQRVEKAMFRYTETHDVKSVRSEQENVALVQRLEDKVLGCSSPASSTTQLQEGLLYIVKTVNRTLPTNFVTEGMRALQDELENECLQIRYAELKR